MKKTFFVSLISLLTPLFATAAAPAGCPIYTNENFTLTELTTLIRTEACQVKTIDDVLALLPERMLSKPVLFYKSKSLQGPHKVDYLNPRTILSSVPNANSYSPTLSPAMMLSFNGHASQLGYDRLETVNLIPTKDNLNVFNYHEIKFPKENKVQTLSWSEVQSKIQISAANPAKCVQCHGQPARPIFQQYPDWEGAYGSRHIFAMSDAEKLGFDEFIKESTTNKSSRYRHLNPMRFKSTGALHSPNQEPGINDELIFGGANQTIKLNTDLSNYNGIRVANMIAKTPTFKELKYAIAGDLYGCDSPLTFFTASVLASLEKAVDQNQKFSSVAGRLQTENDFLAMMPIQSTEFGDYSIIVDTEGRCDGSKSECYKNLQNYFGHNPVLVGLAVDAMKKQGFDRKAPRVATTRLIFEGQGIPLNNWWADLKQPSYRTNSGLGNGWSMYLLELDPSLPKPPVLDFLNPENFENAKKLYCENLAVTSRSAMADLLLPDVIPAVPEPPVNNYPSVFLNTCAKCHVEQSIGPRIPFNNPEMMSGWLKNDGNVRRIEYRVFEAPESQSMPPTRHLTPEEQMQIKAYLSPK